MDILFHCYRAFVLYVFMYCKITIKTYFCKVGGNVRNFPSAAVSGGDFWRQHRCSFDRAGALKVCLRCVGIFDWKD